MEGFSLIFNTEATLFEEQQLLFMVESPFMIWYSHRRGRKTKSSP